MMDSWRKTWRDGLAPQISTEGLEALRAALCNDDDRLMQGATTTPPPLQCARDWPVEAACGITLCGWLGEGLKTVAEAQEYFAKRCFDCDQVMQEPAACRWFLNFWDDEPRDSLLSKMIPEVIMELDRRSRIQETSCEKSPSPEAS